MLTITIPGANALQIEHLVLDFNGTLACDGVLLEGVAQCLKRLSEQLQIHVVTGDSFGSARQELHGLPCELVILGPTDQGQAKLEYVKRLGVSVTACVGNGRNDFPMMQAAALGIAVVEGEGASSQTLAAAAVVVRHAQDALGLLLEPRRLTATLRT